MNVVLADPAIPDNRLLLDVLGVKFQNWSFSLPEDEFVMENVTFKALHVNVRDEEKKQVRTPDFPKAN
jgi:hypothetical protein